MLTSRRRRDILPRMRTRTAEFEVLPLVGILTDLYAEVQRLRDDRKRLIEEIEELAIELANERIEHQRHLQDAGMSAGDVREREQD